MFMDRHVLNIPVNRTVAFNPNKLAEQINTEAKPTALEMGVVLVIPSPLSCDSCVPFVTRKKCTTTALRPFLCYSDGRLVRIIAPLWQNHVNFHIGYEYAYTCGNSQVMRKVTILIAIPRGLMENMHTWAHLAHRDEYNSGDKAFAVGYGIPNYACCTHTYKQKT